MHLALELELRVLPNFNVIQRDFRRPDTSPLRDSSGRTRNLARDIQCPRSSVP